MKRLVLAALFLSACASNEPRPETRFESWPDDGHPMTTEGRARMDAFLEDNGSSSAMVLYEGKTVYQYGDIHEKTLIHSIRKAILGVLYGDLIESGAVDLNETVGSLDLEEPGVPFTDVEKNATVLQLLESRSGIYLPAAAETQAMMERRPERGTHSPGEAYYYNNWSFNALGTLFEARADKTIYAAFEEQLAGPLGMTSFDGVVGELTLDPESSAEDSLPERLLETDGFYLSEPSKSRHRAYHFRLSAHDMALFGQMLVQRGEWQGETVVSPEWIDEVTDCKSETNPNIGGGMRLCYGMMWTVAESDSGLVSFSHTGDGAHLLSIHPRADLVIVHRVPTEDPDYVRGARPSQFIGLTFGAFAPRN